MRVVQPNEQDEGQVMEEMIERVVQEKSAQRGAVSKCCTG